MTKRYTLAAILFVLSASPAIGAELNINKASAEKLQKLDGVGEVKAEAIVDYRNNKGSFESVDELTKVDGIGDVTLEDNRERVTAKAVE